MFLVIGITGNTGAAAADALLRGGHRVRAIVRDAAKAAPWAARGVELVTGDALDRGALAAAMDGAEGAYVMLPPEVRHPDPLSHYEEAARVAGEAARTARLPRLVFLSSEGAHLEAGTGPIVGLHRGERRLEGAAPRLTFLRATYFQENWRPLLGVARAQGVLPTFLADPAEPRAMVATADIGRTAAELLTAADVPRVVELVGPEFYSANDAAAAMAAALGRPVAAVRVPREGWVDALTGAGLGEPYARLLAEMYDGINAGVVAFAGDGVRIAGRVPLAATVASWVEAAEAA